MLNIEDFTECFIVRPTDSVSCFLHKKEGIAFCCNCWRVICEDDSKTCEKHIKKDLSSALKDIVTNGMIEKLSCIDKRIFKDIISKLKGTKYYYKQRMEKLNFSIEEIHQLYKSYEIIDPNDTAILANLKQQLLKELSIERPTTTDGIKVRLIRLVNGIILNLSSKLAKDICDDFTKYVDSIQYQRRELTYDMITNYLLTDPSSLYPEKMKQIFIKNLNVKEQNTKEEIKIVSVELDKLRESIFYLKQLCLQQEKRSTNIDFILRYVFYTVYSYIFEYEKAIYKSFPKIDNPIKISSYVQAQMFSPLTPFGTCSELLMSEPLDTGLRFSIDGPMITFFENPCFFITLDLSPCIHIRNIVFNTQYDINFNGDSFAICVLRKRIVIRHTDNTILIHKIKAGSDKHRNLTKITDSAWKNILCSLRGHGIKRIDWYVVTDRNAPIVTEVSEDISTNLTFYKPLIFQPNNSSSSHTIEYVSRICKGKHQVASVDMEKECKSSYIQVGGVPSFIIPSITEPSNVEKCVVIGQTLLNYNGQTYSSIKELKLKQINNIIYLAENVFIVYDIETKKWMTLRIKPT